MHARSAAAHPVRRCHLRPQHACRRRRRSGAIEGIVRRHKLARTVALKQLLTEQHAMRILDRSVYVGPSLYARFPVIRLELDLGPLEAWPTGRLGDAFVDALASALPGLGEHGCSYREPGGFLRRLREDEGTWLGHVLEHVAIELQNVAGAPDISFGKTRGAGREGVYTVIYEYAQRDEGIA